MSLYVDWSRPSACHSKIGSVALYDCAAREMVKNDSFYILYRALYKCILLLLLLLYFLISYSYNWCSLSCLITPIGKWWTDRVLRDLLFDSGVYAGSTAKETLTRKQVFWNALLEFYSIILNNSSQHKSMSPKLMGLLELDIQTFIDTYKQWGCALLTMNFSLKQLYAHDLFAFTHCLL